MIRKDEVEAAQASWGRAVVGVGAASTWAEARSHAVELVQTHYVLDGQPLLFCPTKAAQHQFRGSLEDAVSYFVGGNPKITEDSGFALEPWTSVAFENADILALGEVGVAMGNYYFGREDGSQLKAEYSFVYVRDDGGKLRIQLHHSALPFSG